MNGTLQKYGLSYEKIAKESGISKTQVYDVLNGNKKPANRKTPVQIRCILEKAGMSELEIRQFKAFSGGSEMLKQLIEKDVFTNSIQDRREIFESESFRIAYGAMMDAVNRRKFVAVVAETGNGKTNLVRYLEEMSMANPSIIISKINNHDFEKVRARNIYEALLFDIQANESPKRSTEALIRQVREILTSHRKEGKKVVLIVDEAHHINKRTLLALKDVWESTYGFSRLVGIILLGQESLGGKLERPENIEVKTRIERIPLRSLTSVGELKGYIKHLTLVKGIELNGEVSDSAYEEVFTKRQSFLGINGLMREAVEIVLLLFLMN